MNGRTHAGPFHFVSAKRRAERAERFQALGANRFMANLALIGRQLSFVPCAIFAPRRLLWCGCCCGSRFRRMTFVDSQARSFCCRRGRCGRWWWWCRRRRLCGRSCRCRMSRGDAQRGSRRLRRSRCWRWGGSCLLAQFLPDQFIDESRIILLAVLANESDRRHSGRDIDGVLGTA